MYNLQITNESKNKTKKTTWLQKKWQTAFVHHEKVYNLQMKQQQQQQNKNNIQTSLVFGKQK